MIVRLFFVETIIVLMPLIVICGCPGSGKSEVASRLRDVFEQKGLKSVIVRDQGLGDYADATTEKRTRGELFSAVERSLSKDMIVIVDALNYIVRKKISERRFRFSTKVKQKGFRYQLFCSAKALSTGSCVVWCLGGDEKCDLGSRFEAPNEKNRWDRPLVLARRGQDGMELDVDRVLEAIAGVPASAPNLSTIAEPRALAHNTDELLTEVVSEIMAQQKDGTGRLARHVTMAGFVDLEECLCVCVF